MILSENGILDILVEKCEKNRVEILIYSAIALVVFGFYCTKICLISNVFFSIAIVCFCVVLVSVKFLRGVLYILGNYSMTIFLTHSFTYCYFSIGRKFFSLIGNIWIKYIVFVVFSIMLAFVIETLKKACINATKYIKKANKVKLNASK